MLNFDVDVCSKLQSKSTLVWIFRTVLLLKKILNREKQCFFLETYKNILPLEKFKKNKQKKTNTSASS